MMINQPAKPAQCMRTLLRDNRGLLIAFVLINLAVKGAFLSINQGEYTDGILQLTVFENKAGLYPPLYGALAQALHGAGLGLELAGRVMSLLAAALCVVPVFWLGARLGGLNAAVAAALFYTLSPMPWRWSVRVMTDSLYLLLSTVAVVALMEAWLSVGSDHRRRAARWLAAGVAAGALACLTRYQGVLLAPLVALAGVVFVRKFRAVPVAACVAGLLWLAVPGWMAWNGFAHGGQMADRVAGSMLANLGAWWNTLESFVLVAPYYLGYPIALFGVLGAVALYRGGAGSVQRAFTVLWGVYAVLLLALHARFGSFQYRYMMPLVPAVVALAGAGYSWLDARTLHHSRRWIQSAALIGSIAYLALLGLAVMTLQRGAFGDQREAAQWIDANVPADVPVYSNERYGAFTELESVKLSFWSGRRVQIVPFTGEPMPAGAVLVLGTAYGGDEAVGALLTELSTRYNLQPLTPEPFRSELLPLMDDIMVNPMFNQNPMGWVMRYVPQRFATQIFRVEPRATGAAQ